MVDDGFSVGLRQFLRTLNFAGAQGYAFQMGLRRIRHQVTVGVGESGVSARLVSRIPWLVLRIQNFWPVWGNFGLS
jgi:hypothetical protein